MSLLENSVIIPSQHEPDEFISPIFLRDKRDGSFRMILNLKTLNEHVQYHHFKMETIETVMSMMTPGCFMASIAVALFTNLGLLIHPDKSVLNPTQQIVFLEGFQQNSVTMTISLTTDKAAKVKDACVALLHNLSPTIREVSQVLVLLTSSMPGVMYGPIHYRSLDMKKTMALQGTRGNYDQPMTLFSSTKHDLN